MENDRKHILLLSSWYPSDAQPFLGNFIQRQIELLGTKYSVQFVQTVAVQHQKKIDVIELKKANYIEITATYPAVKSKLIKKYYQTKALKKALKTVVQPDLLLTYIFLPKIWQFLMLKKQLNIPWVHIEQGSYFRKEIQSKWFYINYITDCKETLEEIQIQYNLMTGRCGILDTDIVGIAFLRKPIQYLHQLQNLYFALTNTELKVNL